MKEDSFFKTNADISENIKQKKDSFDLELEKFNSGNLPDSHIFNLGKPGEILQNCGFPAEHRIELAASRLRMKANQGNHPFDVLDIQGLAGALQKPVAVFEYGDKNKSQNVIVNIEKDGKNFLVGVFFNQKQRGYEVSDIRGLFNRDNMDWMHWIQQGKMIYGNKEKIQVLAEQQRTNLAEVHSKEARTSSDSYYLDSVDNILQSFGDVKDIYTKDFPKYAEQKERFEIFKKFRNAYQEVNAINVLNAVQEADEFYDALKSNNKEVIARYTDAFKYPALADTAKSIIEERSFSQKEKSQENQYAEHLMAQGLDSLDSNKILHQTNSLDNKTTSTLVIDSNQAARIKAAREIKENMPNLSEKERAAAIAILEAGAKSQGMEFSKYVEKTFPDGIFGDIKKAENAAKQQGVNINGAVSVNGFGENVKAVIYAGKTADFSTWCHELSHIWQAQLAGELKNDAEEAFQVKDSDWQNSIYTFKDGHTDTSAEAFAYGFEDFLKNKAGEMAAEDKKKIFEKFADYMSRTYNGVKQHIEINKKIASVYQKFVEFDDNILAQAEKAVQMEVSFSDYFDKTNSVFFELDSGDTTDVSDSILEGKPIKEISTKEFNYDGSNLKDFALNYIKNNPVENAKTKIGNIEISETGLRHSLSHTIYKNKLYAIPAIKDTLEKGTYLGVIKDFEGKRQNNYYFAAPITIDNDKNILFIRVKHVAGRDKALYIHDIFTLDEIKKVTPYSGEPNATRRSLRGATLAKSIIQDYEKNNIIQNNPILFQTAYHGSGANFDKFNTSEYGWSGEGYMAFGYGVYVSNSETIARSYAGIQGERNLYTVEIPDGDYIIWNKTVSKLQKEKAKNELYENLIKEDYKGVEKEISTELNNVFSEDFDGKKLYGTISSYIGSDKETSRFFKDIGYSGIQYPAGTPENAVNYVIFDDNDIKIKNHFQFQIIGELGARELDRNAESNERIANLETAKRMEEAEKDANVIRLATGWEKGADGKWKYEIDDSKVHFNLYDAMEEWDEMHPRYEELREKFFKTELSEEERKEFDQWVDERNEVSDKHTDMDFSEKLFGKTFRLPEVMRHNELFKAYPELKYVTVSIKKTGENGTLGNASYEDKHINLYRHEKDTDGFEEWEKKAGSVLLHEVQHIIQGIEGFAKGASPEMFEESPEASEQSNALAGKFASKEIKIENTELITQIKNVIDWNDKQNKTQAAIPELKIYHTLKEDEENISQVAEKSINEQKTKLQIIEQEDKEQLAAIVMTARKTIKESLAQNAEPLVEVDFSKANYDRLFPRAIVQTPVETVKLGENQFEKLDARDRKRFLLATFQTLATPDLVIDEEREGKHSHNYIKSFVFDEKTKTIQDVVVNINGENVSITAHPRDINNIVNKIKMPDQLVYAAARVGQVIEQRTQEAQSIVNPTRDDRLSTISVPLNKEYNENFALSTVEKLLETEKNAQKATAADFQQIEPALQKKFDKLKAAIKSREEQDIQDISAAEEPGNKKQAIRSKSDIIRQAGKDFLKSVKEGIAPFFNAEDDFQRIIMHPQAIINASNGLPFSGESQLLAQIYHQRQRMEGEVVTSIAGAKAAGTIVLDTPESRQKNFALTDTSSLAEKNAIVRTRYFMPESCEEPDKIYAHTLQRQRPDKIRSYRDLIRHFENIPNGQKEISDIRIRIAHEHLKEIQSRFAIKEKRVLSVDEIEERKNFLRNYFERLPADYRNSERSAFEDTFGIQLNSEKNLEINLQRDFKDIDFAELKKNTKKSIELENRKLSDFIEKNTMEDKKLATLLSDEYKSLSKEEKMTVRNLKIEAIGIKEPETFLGKYLAACNTNAEFITDKETVEEVKKNLVKKLEENFKLEKYDILKEIGQQAQSIGNETTKKISFEKAHSNNKSLEKTQSPDKEISLIGMGK